MSSFGGKNSNERTGLFSLSSSKIRIASGADWARQDLNLRRLTPTGLQPVPFGRSGTRPFEVSGTRRALPDHRSKAWWFYNTSPTLTTRIVDCRIARLPIDNRHSTRRMNRAPRVLAVKFFDSGPHDTVRDGSCRLNQEVHKAEHHGQQERCKRQEQRKHCGQSPKASPLTACCADDGAVGVYPMNERRCKSQPVLTHERAVDRSAGRPCERFRRWVGRTGR